MNVYTEDFITLYYKLIWSTPRVLTTCYQFDCPATLCF